METWRWVIEERCSYNVCRFRTLFTLFNLVNADRWTLRGYFTIRSEGDVRQFWVVFELKILGLRYIFVGKFL